MADGFKTFEGYLIVKPTRWAWELHGRLVAKRPGRLNKGEVPVHIVLNVPDELFREPPILQVRAIAESNAAGAAVEATLRAAGLDVVVLREQAGEQAGAESRDSQEASDE